MKFVRVVLEEIEPIYDYGPIVMDLKVDNAGKVDMKVQVFGAMGICMSDYYSPFSMDERGRVDFGTDSGTRNATLNIAEKTIKKDECCTYCEAPGEKDSTFRIKRIEPLT
jgi:hypothetical protein